MGLKNKHIIVGVSGGIAAYKACDLVHRLKYAGAVVEVIMTKNAEEFVTPLTFATLTGKPVHTSMFNAIESSNWEIDHISLAKKADAIVIAPATANIIGKIAGGIADDLLSTVIMATKAPVLIAPAMNNDMWENKIVQDNIKKLKKFGYKFVGPAYGVLACGVKGAGRLEETDKILNEVERLFRGR